MINIKALKFDFRALNSYAFEINKPIEIDLRNEHRFQRIALNL